MRTAALSSPVPGADAGSRGRPAAGDADCRRPVRLAKTRPSHPEPLVSAPAFVAEPAPAKLNLALHVTGRRPDGYHNLDMLVAFAGFGDRIAAEPAETLSLALTGPFAAGLSAGPGNLVLSAAGALADRVAARGRPRPGARLTLDKALPVASGIGGGSADAAATLRALNRLWDAGLTAADLAAIGLTLGADVPMCLAGRPARVSGIGETVAPLAGLPSFALVLVNPGVPIATPDVFRGLERRDNPPLPALPAHFADLDHLARWLGGTRNDLRAPAIGLVPAVAEAERALAACPDCRFARMSGSGATVFGLFPDRSAAARAAHALRRTFPHWWVAD
ncbi:4-(cytidine 5'-diphospho)-2-C-methyl-D-erythritol kinase [Hyphomicrobiaceae bacterium 22]|uniref:4-diphosphocytidyl-2-C-methyl-D-erythritol kinase n=1 Tax=Prosthecodimorpha staleyi TaxID=2840188 RepID=A0A947D7P6_9HYPH|nr:4-(cytidine 5'-diphospho)-2-C-methyl-D-erythritol kinase [Prosthecodimorpha staleyi]